MLWSLSPREFYALRDIQHAPTVRWAIGQANLSNASFVTEGTPFIADDFLGLSDRKARKAKKDMEEALAARADRAMQMKLRGKPGEPPPDWLPDWAKMTPEEEAAKAKRNGR